jgi:hypothetical protein
LQHQNEGAGRKIGDINVIDLTTQPSSSDFDFALWRMKNASAAMTTAMPPP